MGLELSLEFDVENHLHDVSAFIDADVFERLCVKDGGFF
jgi:hypothetical protein